MKPPLLLNMAIASILALALLGASGCGGAKKPKTDADPIIKIGGPAPISEISEDDAYAFGLAYINVFAKTKSAPKSLDDLDESKDTFKDLHRRIKDGSVVVIWGAPLTLDRDKNDAIIIAHERKAPERGGLVISGAARVDVISADEFQKRAK